MYYNNNCTISIIKSKYTRFIYKEFNKKKEQLQLYAWGKENFVKLCSKHVVSIHFGNMNNRRRQTYMNDIYEVLHTTTDR